MNLTKSQCSEKRDRLVVLLCWCICLGITLFFKQSLAINLPFLKPHGPKIIYQINGLTEPVQNNVEERLKLYENNLQKPISAQTAQKIFNAAPDNIKSAISPYGYFQATISKRLTRQGKDWIASFRINPGPQVMVSRVNVQITGPGSQNLALQTALRKFPLHPGDAFNSQLYEQAKQNFFTVAQTQGYLDGQLTAHSVQIDLQTHTATIDLIFATGPRYYFGNIQFSPNPYSPRFLRRFAPFTPGQPYSTDTLLKLQNNLGHSIYFQTVTVKADKNHAVNNVVPIDVMLVPRKRHQYTLGAGFGTDTGFRGNAGWEWRRVNRWGHYIQAVGQVSQIQNNFQARYVIPGRNPVTDHYSLYTGISNNQPGNGRYTLYRGGSDWVKQLFGWTQTLSMEYQNEDYVVVAPKPMIHTEYLVPGISWQRTKADNNINADNGYRAFLNFEGGYSLVQNDRFIEAELRMKYIVTLLESSRIILRTDLGYATIHNLTYLPLSVRFFAGGDTSVRGYAYQSLGPGKYLIVGSGEYQHRIYGNWYLAAFCDVGNAFNMAPMDLRTGVGGGIVWRSPLGPIELDLAQRLYHPSPHALNNLRIHFIMGPDL